MSTNPCAAFYLKAPQPSIAMSSQQQGAAPMSPPPVFMGSHYTLGSGMTMSSVVGNELANRQMVAMEPGGSVMSMGQDTGQLMMSQSGMMVPMMPSAIPLSNQASLMSNQTPLMAGNVMMPLQSSLPKTMPNQITSMNSGVTPEQMANSTASCTNVVGMHQPDGLTSPPHSATTVPSAVTMGPFTSATTDPASQGSKPTTPTTTSGQGVTECPQTTSESTSATLTSTAEGGDPYKAVAEYEEAIAQYNNMVSFCFYFAYLGDGMCMMKRVFKSIFSLCSHHLGCHGVTILVPGVTLVKIVCGCACQTTKIRLSLYQFFAQSVYLFQ